MNTCEGIDEASAGRQPPRAAAGNQPAAAVRAACAAALALGLTAAVPSALAQAGMKEQCFGIAKAGENDGGLLQGPGLSKKDYAIDDFRYVAKGTCQSVGGLTRDEALREVQAIRDGLLAKDHARQLMDYAQRQFPSYFPGHPRTETAAPFDYRHYPGTGVYLGVTTTADAALAAGEVFVLGGPFGEQLLHAGPLTAFIEPITPGGYTEGVSVPGHAPGVRDESVLFRPASVKRAIVFLLDPQQPAAIAESGVVRTHPRLSEERIDWGWLASNEVAVAFVSGGPGGSGGRFIGATSWTAWNNRATTSNRDDVAFLAALAGQLRGRFGIDEVLLAGHGMGGTMVHRVWCESPASYSAYLSFAGPPSSHYADGAGCSARRDAPAYWAVVGAGDAVLQNAGRWDSAAWPLAAATVQHYGPGMANASLAGEWRHFAWKANAVCGEQAALGAAQRSGAEDRWQHCGGRLRLTRLAGAGHELASMAAQAAVAPLQLAVEWLREPSK